MTAPPPLSPSLDGNFNRLPPSISDEDPPFFQLSARDLWEIINNENPRLRKPRHANNSSHLLATEYMIPPPSEKSEAGSFSSEKSFLGKKRGRSSDDSDSSDEWDSIRHESSPKIHEAHSRSDLNVKFVAFGVENSKRGDKFEANQTNQISESTGQSYTRLRWR